MPKERAGSSEPSEPSGLSGLNVRADLLITRELLGTAPIKAQATVWWLGTRFRVHVNSGLPLDDLLALANELGGLGRLPRTAEQFMDTWTDLPGTTEIYGDRQAPRGTVIRADKKLEPETSLPSPLAELILSGDVSTLKPTAHARLLDREAVEYTTYLPRESGARSQLRRMVSGPYTLLREVTDQNRPDAASASRSQP